MATTYPLLTKEERQIAKLELAQAKRQALGTVGYRVLNCYNRDLLPTEYIGNDVFDNPNIGGLQIGRPWTSTPPIVSPTWLAPTNHSIGFANIVYDSTSWGGNLAWFAGKTPYSTIYNSSTPGGGFGPGGYTGVFTGYFVATQSGSYTVSLIISEFNGEPIGNDAIAKMWVGTNAISPTDVNMLGSQVLQGGFGISVDLVVGDWYPILVIAGFLSTGGSVNVTVAGGDVSNSTSWNDGQHSGHNTDTGRI